MADWTFVPRSAGSAHPPIKLGMARPVASPPEFFETAAAHWAPRGRQQPQAPARLPHFQRQRSPQFPQDSPHAKKKYGANNMSIAASYITDIGGRSVVCAYPKDRRSKRKRL